MRVQTQTAYDAYTPADDEGSLIWRSGILLGADKGIPPDHVKTVGQGQSAEGLQFLVAIDRALSSHRRVTESLTDIPGLMLRFISRIKIYKHVQVAGKSTKIKRSGSNKKKGGSSVFSLFGNSGKKSSMFDGKERGSKKHSPKKVKVGGAPWWM